LPLPVRESRGGSSNSSLSTSATRTRDGPKTGRQSNQHAVDENTGRRFRGWDISANVGVKLHAQVKDKMTRFMAEAAPHFAE
jgi:hypothetical protein